MIFSDAQERWGRCLEGPGWWSGDYHEETLLALYCRKVTQKIIRKRGIGHRCEIQIKFKWTPDRPTLEHLFLISIQWSFYLSLCSDIYLHHQSYLRTFSFFLCSDTYLHPHQLCVSKDVLILIAFFHMLWYISSPQRWHASMTWGPDLHLPNSIKRDRIYSLEHKIHQLPLQSTDKNVPVVCPVQLYPSDREANTLCPGIALLFYQQCPKPSIR